MSLSIGQIIHHVAVLSTLQNFCQDGFNRTLEVMPILDMYYVNANFNDKVKVILTFKSC